MMHGIVAVRLENSFLKLMPNPLMRYLGAITNINMDAHGGTTVRLSYLVSTVLHPHGS